MFSASSIRFHLLLSTAVAAFSASPAVGQIVHAFPVLDGSPGADGGADVPPPFGNTLTIGLPDLQPRTIIRWDSFDIDAGNEVDFEGIYTCPCGGTPPPLAVLNRVTGTDSSDILGKLTSEPNIEVFLINPNGILFGSQARVDVGSFVASTLGITDSDFLLGDAVPTELTFQGNVSTGITVDGGAQLTTESGPLALIGGFIDVQSGSIVNGATDVAFVAANSVNIPADPGSPLTYAITTFGPTSVSNGITVGGQVSGRSVALIQENQADAVDALLFVSASATITATKSGGGDIVLSLAARTTSEGSPAISPGRVENHGKLTASGSIYLGGAVASSSGEFHAPQNGEKIDLYLPQTVENDGTLDAGGDVLMQAYEKVTNHGTIDAGGDVTLSAYATGSAFAPAGDVQVTNSGDITAGGDVLLRATFSGAEYESASAPALNVGVTNSGPITAGGDVNLVAKINLSEVSASSFAFADVEVTNSGPIAAGGDVTLSGAISISSFTADTIALSSSVQVINSGSITAGGDVSLLAEINLSDFSATDISVAPEVEVLNSGPISAGGDVKFDAAIHLSNFSAYSTIVSPSANVTNRGTVNAGGNGTFTADDNITNSGAISVDGVATLDAGADIDNSGSIAAGGDAILTAGGDILDSSGTLAGSISGADVALSAGGSITAGTVTARDDIAIRAPGPIITVNLTSGATIGSLGPVDVAGAADQLLPGVDLSGHDVDVDGSTIAANVIRAFGPGSDIRLRAPVTASREDLDFAAGGNVTVESPLAATDVAIDAGGTITTGAITARDDIALRAGDTLNVGTLTSGVAIDGTGPVDTAGAADALLGADLAGHDLFVQGGHVSLTQATANGTGSDLTIRATTGDLSIVNGTAGGMITLAKEGTTGILTAGTLLAGTGASLTSTTNIDADRVETVSGDLNFAAGGDVTVHNPLAATDVAIDAGGTITTGAISARDDIALRAGNTLNVGTLRSGVAVGGTGPVDTAGAADALLDDDLAGNDLFVQGGHVSLADASANGTGSDLIVRATNGDLSITNGQAGGTITLVKEGSSGTLNAATLTAGTGASLTSSTGIDADNVQSASGDVDFDAVQGVTLGTALAQSGNVKIVADDLDILGGITGAQVSITNRSGGNAVTVLGDASAPGAFTLTEAELNRINAPIVNIDSLDQNLLVGNVAFDNEIGSTRINLLGTARVDVVGEIDASGVNRTLQIGGTTGAASPTDPATLASIIRIAPMSSGGGRIILGSGSLDLRGAKIGVGLDDGFLSPLGLIAGGSPVSTAIVQEDWIGNFNSTLYGIPGGYADPVVISAGSITVTYTDYALFQNTAGKGLPSGVNADNLFIVSSGDDGNGFELFGRIDQVGGVGAAFLVKPTTVSLGNSRINGCLILTGGGCGGTPGDPTIDTVDPSVPPGGNDGDDLFGAVGDQFAQQDLISTDEDQAFSFDSLVGTNNEGLLGVMGVD